MGNSNTMFSKVGAVQALPDLNLFTNPPQQQQHCQTSSPVDAVSPGPIDKQYGSAHEDYRSTELHLQQGLVHERHLGTQESAVSHAILKVIQVLI